MPIRILHYGLGPIGVGVLKQTIARKGFQSVGAVDTDPAKVGKDAGEIAGIGRTLRIRVTQDAARAIRETRPDVVVLCTSSFLKQVLPQIEGILRLKVPIVSTTEELAYPYFSNKRLAKRIDEMAKKAKVAVVGTGVNPGFVMDVLPITLTGVCERVDTVRIDRIQDARSRRFPFQQKIGAGMTKAEFQTGVDLGRVRHVGFTQSVAMIGDAFGWKLDKITDEIEPKIAHESVSSDFMTVEKGFVCGLIQDGIGYRDGKPLITLHMEAYLGAPESYDAMTIEGSPRLAMRISGGIHGDIATASITVNTIPKIIRAPAGLRTMRDMVLPSFYGGK